MFVTACLARCLSWSSLQEWDRVDSRRGHKVPVMDRPLLFILLALSVTTLLFAVGVFPYPVGLVVLTLFAVGRYLQVKGPA